MDTQAEQRHVRREMLRCMHALSLIIETMPPVHETTHEPLDALDDIDHQANRLTRLSDQHHMIDDGGDAVLVG